MIFDRRQFLAAAGASLAAGAAQAQAPAYPNGAVKIVVPFSAGGTADIFARLIADHLNKAWNNPFVVENVGGGGGTLGVAQVARARPDGQTLLVGSTSGLSINPTLNPSNLPYRIEQLAPLTQISVVPNVLAVHPERVPVRSIPELITFLKARPGDMAHGSAGIGTTQHLAGALFQQLTGTEMIHVPYRGSSQMLNDLLSGQVPLTFDNVPLLLPHAATGRLRLLGTCTPQRAAFDPNLPAVAEVVPGFEAVAWHGFLAPAGTPRPVIERLANEIGVFMRRPETQRRFAELGAVAVATTPDEFTSFIGAETARWRRVIETGNIRPE